MATATNPPSGTGATVQQDKRHRSVFDLPSDFFDSCRLISPSAAPISETSENSNIISTSETLNGESNKEEEEGASRDVVVQASPRWTCNTCKVEFESLQEQRLHFKSDIHRFNLKLSISGKNIVKEEDFDELTSDSFKDFEVSSISGSEDEADKESCSQGDPSKGIKEIYKRKLFIQLKTGERISLWKSLLLNESEDIIYEDNRSGPVDIGGSTSYLKENEVTERLKKLINEPRDKTCLRIVLLASGGHFAGCVFDGASVVAHKTFHRYVVRAKAGKKQSSKDASGKTIHSAGAALRRYNEFALKKDVQELLAAWKPFFDASSSVFLYAPSNNRQLLFDGEKPYFSSPRCFVRNIPLTIRRPTLKEARRLYSNITQLSFETEDKTYIPAIKEGLGANETSIVSDKEDLLNNFKYEESSNICSTNETPDEKLKSSESESEVVGTSTELHVASQSGDVHQVLELLEHGLDPCVKDERGRTPYMLAKDKEVRNTFRRFMALNMDKWDWHAAKVPSALTKEMEESQAAKQAEKDAKKKARAKELKKLKRAKEKKAKAEAALSQNANSAVDKRVANTSKQLSKQSGAPQISKEEELKREREKRAAAAERRMSAAAAAAQGSSTTVATSTSQSNSGLSTDAACSCCHASLAGKVPFHRYSYKYCSTTCMHLHREMLEDS